MRALTMRIGLAVAVLGSLAVQAKADLVIDQSPPDLVTAYFSDTGFPQYIADNFILATSATINEIVFWGIYSDNTAKTDNLTLLFYADASGSPGPVETSFAITPSRVDTGMKAVGKFELYRYDASFTSVALTAGTHWVGVVNSTGVWAWATFSQTGGVAISATSPVSGPWDSYPPANQAFQLYSPTAVATPEPSALVSASIGVAMMLGYGWRKRRTARPSAA